MDTSAAVHPPRKQLPLIALYLADTVSIVGNRFTTLSVPWFVLITTGSITKTGITGAVTALSFVASLFGGSLVDRFGFKRVSVAADLTSGIAVALIPLLYHTVGLAYWQLLLLVFLRAFCNTPGGTARSALLPDLIALAGVRRERANGVYDAVANGGYLVAAALVGILIAWIGASNMLWLDGATFLFSATVIGLAIPATRRGPLTQRESYFVGLAAGWHFLTQDRPLLTLTVIGTIENFTAAALTTVVMPVYAQRVYGTAVALGVLFGAFAAGVIVGALVAAAVGPHVPRHLLYGGAIVVYGGVLCLLALSPPLAIAAAIIFVQGLANGPINLIAVTVMQERIPSALRGRVFGTSRALGFAATPLGGLVAGYVVAGLGVQTGIVGISVLLIAVGAWVMGSRVLRAMNLPPSSPLS